MYIVYKLIMCSQKSKTKKKNQKKKPRGFEYGSSLKQVLPF